LKLVRIIFRGMNNIPTNFAVSWTFRMACQMNNVTLIVTMIFDFGGHGVDRDVYALI